MAGLGDMLMLTPALAALQDRYPNARIDLITLHEYVKEAFQRYPRIDTINTLPAYPGQWIISKFIDRSAIRLVFAAVWHYAPLLLRYSFLRPDVGINFGLSDFDRNLGNALLFCLNVRKRVGSPGHSDKLLTDQVTVDYQSSHRTTAYLSFLRPLGVASEERAYEFQIRNDDLERVKLALRREHIDLSRPLAVVNPGGKIHVNSRRWPAEYYARLCDFLSIEAGFQVVLIGDDDDRDVCNEIARRQSPRVKSMAGGFSFSESAALLSFARLCITNDTSTLHLAEAVQVPRVISIFGPTNPDLLAPQNDRNVVFRSHLDCAPCMGGLIDANTQRCWRDVKEECLVKITPDQVISAIRQTYAKPVLHAERA
jgi:ADP-heptose:LPS heptosyltransferase